MRFEQREGEKFSAEFQSGYYSRKETEEEIKETLRKNRAVLEGIQSKIKNIETVLKNSNLKYLSDSEYFYPIKNWPAILNIFQKTERALYSLVENPSISFSSENKITHFLGNGIQLYSRLVERFMKVMLESTEGRKSTVGKEVDFLMEEGQKNYFQKNKEVWDYTLYYLDYMADDENSWMLAKEITSEEGFLDESGIKECITKNPREDLDRLKFINFFVRLEGNWSSRLKDISGMEGICQPIGEGNFDEEFNKLRADESLDKEAARGYMRKFEQEKISLA